MVAGYTSLGKERRAKYPPHILCQQAFSDCIVIQDHSQFMLLPHLLRRLCFFVVAFPLGLRGLDGYLVGGLDGYLVGFGFPGFFLLPPHLHDRRC